MRINLPGIRRRIGKITLSDPVRTGVASALVGLLTGIGVWIFKQLFQHLQVFAFQDILGYLKPLGGWTVIFAPVAGSLIVGWIDRHWIGKERYHGLPGIIEATALGGGRLPYRKMPMRVLAAALSIGSGASVGPEDPSVDRV